MNNRIYLVTGAAGFLGSHVCSELLERGDRVRALVLPRDPGAKFIPASVEVVEGNLCDMDSLSPFFAVPEGTETYVIHCASMVTTNPDFNQKLIDVNVGGTKNIIEQCLSHHECKKLVYVSSTGAIPEQPKGIKITETRKFAPVNPKTQVGCYSQSKAMATQEVLDACDNRGLRACVVHPSGILGPDDHAISETTGTVIKIMNGEMSVGMGGSFNLCDVRDLAHGCIAACDRGRIGECYILGNEEVTLKEVCQMLHDASGCKMPLFYVPIRMAYMLAAQMEKRAAKTGEKPLMTNFAVYNLARNNSFDYSKAKRELGYSTRPYAETLADEAKWLVKEGHIKGAVAQTAEHPQRKGILSADEAATVRKLITNRDFVRQVAAVESADALELLAAQCGIYGCSQEMLEECYQGIALSQNWQAVKEMLTDKDFESVSRKLASYGMTTTRENFDLINDIVAIAQNEELMKLILEEPSILKICAVLYEHGYHAIHAGFLSMLRENVSGLVEDGLLDIRDLSGKDFWERCEASLNLLAAMSALVELQLKLSGAMNPAFLIAMAGGVSLLEPKVSEITEENNASIRKMVGMKA